MNRILLASAVVFALMIALSALFYGVLPEEIATHWNGWGQPDSYSPKLSGLFILPALAIIVSIGLMIVPKIDPLKKNIMESANEYYGFILVFAIFFLVLHSFIIAFNLGNALDIRLVVIPGIAAIIGYAGFLMSRIKRNYFIGIRTPWTLASDNVWIKTHRLAAKLFYAYAALLLISAVFPDFFLYAIILPVIAITSIIFAYSFVEYTREEKAKSK